jgi:hypothetical protein
MRSHGVPEPFYGVKIGDLKKIKKRVKKDYQLALDKSFCAADVGVTVRRTSTLRCLALLSYSTTL